MTIDIPVILRDLTTHAPQKAHIIEASCIGCTKCIQACPVDAIVGTNKHMHTIFTQDCIGCGLCVDPCPVDCIELHPSPSPLHTDIDITQRIEAKQQRTLRAQQNAEAITQQKRILAAQTQDAHTERLAKKEYIIQAIRRKLTPSETPS